MILSPHFTLDEMTVSQEAARSGLRNDPDAYAVRALESLCLNVLEPLRVALRKPVVVNSGYRSPTINRRIGGVRGSQHCKGEAADIIVPGMSVDALFYFIRAGHLPFDQVINEFSSWVHVSYSYHGPQRGNVLLAYRSQGSVQYRALK